jgi:predicted GNAT superfamily acetyltransferase
VSAGAATDRVQGFRFRRLDKPEEFRQAEELQRSVAGSSGTGVVDPSLLRALQDHGGLVVGAFADIYLAGCAISTIGWDGSVLYHYSHLTVVRPEYRNHHLGFRLKAFQRDEVLRLGLPEVRWLFDPLVSRNAWLYVRRLGSQPDDYLTHYFGRLPEAGEAGKETDRIRTRWAITSPRVEDRLAGRLPTRAEDERRCAEAERLIETEPGESGLRVPTAVAEPTGPRATIEIPFDLAALEEHEPASFRRWRHAVRDAFRAAFDRGLVVEDFTVVSIDHERRGFYLLSPAPGPSSPGAGPSAATSPDPGAIIAGARHG